jgi:hypothetical protein
MGFGLAGKRISLAHLWAEIETVPNLNLNLKGGRHVKYQCVPLFFSFCALALALSLPFDSTGPLSVRPVLS